MSKLSHLVRPHIAAIHPYTPGLQPAEPGWTKLNTNECPYPPSPKVAEALREEIGGDGGSLRLYPNPKSLPLRAAVARLHGVGEDQVCIGNGSDDILNLLVRCLGSGTVGVGFTLPSYSLYPVLVGIENGRPAVVEFDRGMQLPWDKIAAAPARVFFLTSPNAPTGVGFSAADIARLLGIVPGILVVDEAYAAFAEDDAIGLLRDHPNLVVVRTLSKAYALAGIRIGYALARPEVIGWLDRVRDSYNVNRLSQVAALAALSDPGYYRQVIARIKDTRDRTYREWTARGWFTYRSQANFLFTEPVDARGRRGPETAQSAYDFLYARRVLVRHFPSHALTAPFLRVSVGTDDEMAVLNHTLDEWLKAPSHA